MKKILISLVVLMMIFTIGVFAEDEDILIMPISTLSYSDISDSSYKQVIEKLSNEGIIDGFDDGTFRPNDYVTRAQMAKLLITASDIHINFLIEPVSSYKDVPKSYWANYYISCAEVEGIIRGDGDGNFRPEDKVKYCEAFAMMSRILKCEGYLTKSGVWPTNYIELAKLLEFNINIIDTNYNSYATREQVAQLVYNMVNISIKGQDIIAQEKYPNLIRDDSQELEYQFLKYTFYDEQQEKGYRIEEKDDDILLYVTTGLQSSGGYSFKITNIRIDGKNIEFDIDTIEPKDGEIVTMALTYPTAIYKLNMKPDSVKLNWN